MMFAHLTGLHFRAVRLAAVVNFAVLGCVRFHAHVPGLSGGWCMPPCSRYQQAHAWCAATDPPSYAIRGISVKEHTYSNNTFTVPYKVLCYANTSIQSYIIIQSYNTFVLYFTLPYVVLIMGGTYGIRTIGVSHACTVHVSILSHRLLRDYGYTVSQGTPSHAMTTARIAACSWYMAGLSLTHSRLVTMQPALA